MGLSRCFWLCLGILLFPILSAASYSYVLISDGVFESQAYTGQNLFQAKKPMVDSLVVKTRSWEEDHSVSFNYDGVPLLATLDDYVMLRRGKEEEKRRPKDSRKFSEQQNADQEAIDGPKPCPARPITMKKLIGDRLSVSGNGTSATDRRLSLNTL